MAKGIASVKEAIRQQEQKKQGSFSDAPRKFFLSVGDGETVIVRFLEQGDDLQWAWVHDVPPVGKEQYPSKHVCIDQDEDGAPVGKACPGCERQYKRSFQGAVNVIWRDAPVYATDENNKVVKDSRGNKEIVSNEDRVAIWTKGITVFEDLIDLDVDWKGLTSRDFKITRKGNGFATRYTIKPVDLEGGAQKMSKADLALAEDKYDLSDFTVPSNYDDWGINPWNKEKEDTPSEPPSESSPFARKRS